MPLSYTAVIRRRGAWWIGWIEEVPGANSCEELLENLQSALEEALEMDHVRRAE